MDNEKLDALLKEALGTAEQPSPKLIRKVYNHMEESEMRKPTVRRSFGGAAVFAATLVLLTTVVFAALHYLTPSQLAEARTYPSLAQAFHGEDAVQINETQTEDGYEVTLLGLVSGSGLEFTDDVQASSTYAVVAFRSLGEQPETNEDWFSLPFFVSPLIHGQQPWRYNIASMGGGYVSHIADGVMYHLIECDSLEMFADRGLSLIVSSTPFYSTEAYDYDETTGLVTPNPNFDGVNMLFDLPLDVTKADHAKAQEYLDHLWDDADAGERREPDDGTEIPEYEVIDETNAKLVSEETLNTTVVEVDEYGAIIISDKK